MASQTYQVSASATKSQTVRPPFEARSVSASNNAAVNVTVSDDLGGSFTLSPGQTKTQGYRSAPGSWTITATSDGPGSVALTLSSDYAPGDATPQNVGQSQQRGGAIHLQWGIFFQGGGGPLQSGLVDTSAGQEAIVTLVPFNIPVGGNVRFEAIIDFGLSSQVYLPSFETPNGIQTVQLHFGRSSSWPLAQSLAFTGNGTNAPNWGVDAWINIYGG